MNDTQTLAQVNAGRSVPAYPGYRVPPDYTPARGHYWSRNNKVTNMRGEVLNDSAHWNGLVIRGMEDSHILNTLEWLMRNPRGWPNRRRIMMVHIRREAISRGLIGAIP